MPRKLLHSQFMAPFVHHVTVPHPFTTPHPLPQMEHSGTKDTRATFEDKMRYLTMLKKQYGKALPKKSE